MHRPLVGTVTIGQAPRPDVSPIIEASLPAGTTCLHTGLLDGLTHASVDERYAARHERRFLVTRLLDGTEVRLDAERVEEGLRDQLRGLEESGCDIIVLLSTGAFHGLRCERAFLVQPDLVIPPVVAGCWCSREPGAHAGGYSAPFHGPVQSGQLGLIIDTCQNTSMDIDHPIR